MKEKAKRMTETECGVSQKGLLPLQKGPAAVRPAQDSPGHSGPDGQQPEGKGMLVGLVGGQAPKPNHGSCQGAREVHGTTIISFV